MSQWLNIVAFCFCFCFLVFFIFAFSLCKELNEWECSGREALSVVNEGSGLCILPLPQSQLPMSTASLSERKREGETLRSTVFSLVNPSIIHWLELHHTAVPNSKVSQDVQSVSGGEGTGFGEQITVSATGNKSTQRGHS